MAIINNHAFIDQLVQFRYFLLNNYLTIVLLVLILHRAKEEKAAPWAPALFNMITHNTSVA